MCWVSRPEWFFRHGVSSGGPVTLPSKLHASGPQSLWVWVHVWMDAEKNFLLNNSMESFKIQISVEYQKHV